MAVSETVNSYWRQLTAEEIAAGQHRDFVGGMWDEIGALQFAFLQAQGLVPDDRLLDVGCGALRGGVHFVRYLARGNYCGLDVNASLIEAGARELGADTMREKMPHLAVSDAFDFGQFRMEFRFALAVSVFTHLNMNLIVMCLANVRKVLAPGGRFFASYFEAPTSAHLQPMQHPSGITTYYTMDAYHHSFAEMQALAAMAGLRVERIGEWRHPRGQLMLSFAAL